MAAADSIDRWAAFGDGGLKQPKGKKPEAKWTGEKRCYACDKPNKHEFYLFVGPNQWLCPACVKGTKERAK